MLKQYCEMIEAIDEEIDDEKLLNFSILNVFPAHMHVTIINLLTKNDGRLMNVCLDCTPVIEVYITERGITADIIID